MSDELLAPSLNQTTSLESYVTSNNQLLGHIFLEARKAKNMTQQDVSSELRLSVKQIEALETNDFSALPLPMITRGFIRNYARLLEIDPEPLLLSYRTSMPDMLPHSIRVETSLNLVVSSPKNQSWESAGTSNKLKYGVLLAVIVALLAWVFSLPMHAPTLEQNTGNDVVADKAPVQPTEQPLAALPEIALPAAERQEVTLQENVVDATALDQSANLNQTDKTVQSAIDVKSARDLKPNASHLSPTGDLNQNAIATQANISAVKVNPQAADLPAVKPSLPTNGLPINNAPISSLPKVSLEAKPVVAQLQKKALISSSESSWVSVKDKSGKVVFERMLVPAMQYSFDGIPPFNVVIGNAKATKLVYLGQPVDLSLTTENNVAHPVLE